MTTDIDAARALLLGLSTRDRIDRKDAVGALLLLDEQPALWEEFDFAVELMDDDAACCLTCEWEGEYTDLVPGLAGMSACPGCGGEDIHGFLTTYNPLAGENVWELLGQVGKRYAIWSKGPHAAAC